MPTRLRLDDVRKAAEARDPDLVALIVALTTQPDDAPAEPVRDGAATWDRFIAELRSKPFGKLPAEERRSARQARIAALEAPDAEVPLPDRLRLHEVILALWEDGGPYARSNLLRVVAEVPLRYGPWRALKRVFKEAEARDDTEVFGALAARLDAAGPQSSSLTEVGSATLSYLRRRAWRYLRRVARDRPACYADAAVDVLARYDESTYWDGTLVANHIFHHGTGKYDRSGFHLYGSHADLLKNRAYPDLWRRSPRPLFGLLERARSETARRFAAEALKADFRATLREVEPAWVARLTAIRSAVAADLAVWVLGNVPRFEQASFRSLGLHDAVIGLFDSPSNAARTYAADYARTHARDLPVDRLILLANNDHKPVRDLAADLLQSRDPRGEVGLDAWGRLLETPHGHKLAAAVLLKHFGASELTPDWFRDRLMTPDREAFQFASTALLRLHPAATLGPAFFLDLLDRADARPDARAQDIAQFALEQVRKLDPNALDPAALQRLILRPATRWGVAGWVGTGALRPARIGVGFLRSLAFHPDWEADGEIQALRRDGPTWARDLAYDEMIGTRVLEWLGDVRNVAPADLGFAWLLTLAGRGEKRYHDFAVATMIKGFTPADFAAPAAEAEAPAPTAPAAVDLSGASFLFTGKMATMQRKDAEAQVKALGGAVASGVTPKLHYLVIGDDGSPLFGHGKKGSKQVKADEINAAGGNIRIISETAFLKQLAGHSIAPAPAGSALEGAARLWAMAEAAGPADAPLSRFAIRYLRRHHPDLARVDTDRPVDPGAEIPAEFLTFERVEPWLRESRKPLRDLALDLARWEFARWAPPPESLIALAEGPHDDVRRFVAEALLCDDLPENRRFRLDPATLGAAAVFRFCESADEPTRALGLRLIDRVPQFQQPDELFRLVESPDRRVREFVIRVLWSLYRDRGTTPGWRPHIPPAPTVGAAAIKKAAARAEVLGTGAPARPDRLPAGPVPLWDFLRRTLFTLPPARPPKRPGDAEAAGPADRVKPLPARRAKLALIETWRDLALDDADFARGVLPLFRAFTGSRGRSERDACLVAVARIGLRHPELRTIPAATEG